MFKNKEKKDQFGAFSCPFSHKKGHQLLFVIFNSQFGVGTNFISSFCVLVED